jgi:O-antigen/teichoic acid export membrane protein
LGLITKKSKAIDLTMAGSDSQCLRSESPAAVDQKIDSCQETPTLDRTLKQIVILIGAQGGLGVLAFATGTIAARLLGPKGRGEFAAIQLLGSLFATFATLGLSDATTLYCAKDPKNAKSHVCSAMLLSAIAGAPFLFVGYLAIPHILSSQSEIVISTTRWYMLIVLFYLLFEFPHGAMRGLGDFAGWSAFRYVAPVSSLVVLLIAWLTGHVSPQFIALFGLGVLSVLSWPLAFYIFRRRLSGSTRLKPQLWIPMLRFSLPSVGSALPKYLNLRLDQVVMAALLPPRMLGLYAVAVAWSSMIGPIFEALGAFLFPRVALHTSPEGQTRALLQITKFATPIAAIEIITVCLITPWGLTVVFGESFRESIPAALILIVAGAALYLGQLLEEGIRGLGQSMPIFWSEIAGLIVTALSLAALLRPLGILGAAISSLLGYTTVWLVLLTRVRLLTGSTITEILFPSRAELQRGWLIVQSLGARS